MERMADWKSVVDPTSGKTYWYHRKTRESRWVKPQFIEEMEDNIAQEPKPSTSRAASSSTTQSRPSQLPQTQVQSKGLVLERDVYRFYGGESRNEVAGLNKLFDVISDKTFERSLLLDTAIISDLSSFAITASDYETRWLALRSLWKLATFRHISSRALHQNPNWKGIATYISKWKQPSLKLLVLALFSCTIIGETTDTIPDEDYAVLCGEAKALYVDNEPLSGTEQSYMSRTIDLLSKQALFYSSEQGKKGHVLPSFLLLLLSKYHLYSPAPLPRVLASNIAACLQRVYVAHQVFEESEIAVFAKELLLQCMVKSVDVLEGILDGFLAISTDISQTAKALGPSPSTYAYLKDAVSEAELEEAVHGGLFEVKTYHDLPDEAAERFLRDVEWIPKSGVGWQLNSVLLWLRCPALRDLVNDFWQQGGGSHTAETAGSVLELSIDASDEVVETICHYVHYGGLILPPTLTLQLETLKVASELGLLALQDQLEHFLCQDINATNLDTLYQAARENRYRRIEDGCVRFMNGELQDHRREDALQRTLASSITGGFSMSQFAAAATVATSATTGNGTVGTQLRTKDLHDFEDIPDDVLHGTFANRTGSAAAAAGTSKRNEHLSEAYGGHLTASNPSVDYRAMNDEADSYLQSLKLPQKVQEYQQDMYGGQHAPATDLTSDSRRPGSNHANGKMKSGGIYSLLLGDNEDGFGQDGMYATDAYGKEVLKDTAKRPGSGKAGLAQTSSAAGLASSAGATGSRKSVGGTKTLSQLQEFDPNTMSLVPRKEKNEHEKRLEELSKPRSQQRKSTTSGLATSDLDVDTSTNSDPYANEMDRPSSTRSKPSSAASTARPGTATKRPPSGSANNQQKSTTKQPTARGRVSSYGGEEDNDLPDDLYLQDTFIEEREDVPARLSGTMSAPSMQRPTSSSANGRGGGGGGGAPLLSSTSNPRLRTSSAEPVFPTAPTDGDASPVLNDHHGHAGVGSGSGGSGGGGGTQIRSSLALLKAKVSKTGGGPASGRTRRISAGAAVGNFAGTDSESPSPVPSSSSAGQVSAPSSLNNTLEGNGRPSSGTLRQSFNRTGSDRYNQNNSNSSNNGGGYASSSQQQRRSAYDDDDDEDNAYADDFDHDDGGFGATSTSRSKSLGASRGPATTASSRSSQQQQQQQQQQPQKSQPRFNQGYEETDDHEDDEYPPRSSAAAYLRQLENDPDAFGGGDDADDDNYGAEFAGGNTMECPDCGRHFAPEPFNRHVKVCKKVFVNKRKVFDSSKQRLMANPETLAAAKKNGRNKNLNKTASNGGGGGGSSSGASKWKEQSRQFREAMRSARGATSGGVDVVVAGGGSGGGGGGAPPQPYIDPTLIQCPNCQRRFNDKAAERHIPICKSIIAKPSALKKGGGQTAGTLAATQTRGGPGASSGGMSSGNGNGNGGGGGGFNGARTTGAGRW